MAFLLKVIGRSQSINVAWKARPSVHTQGGKLGKCGAYNGAFIYVYIFEYCL